MLQRIIDWFNELRNNAPEIFDFLTMATAFVGKLIAALIFYLIGRTIAKALAKGIRKMLKKVGVDKLADRLREIDLLGKSNFKIVPSEFFAKIIYYIFLFIIIWIAAEILNIQSLSDMIKALLAYLPTLFAALAVFVGGLFLADFLKKIILTTTKSLNLQAGPIIANFVFYFLFINVAIISLAQAGIETDAIKDNISIILGGLVGAFAIGYGFASRNLLASMLSAYYNRKKIAKGDVISIDGVSGTIIDIDNTSLSIQSDKDKKIVVPLSKLLEEKYELKKQEVYTIAPPSGPNPEA